MSPAVSLAPEGQDDLSVEDLDFWALFPKAPEVTAMST